MSQFIFSHGKVIVNYSVYMRWRISETALKETGNLVIRFDYISYFAISFMAPLKGKCTIMMI